MVKSRMSFRQLTCLSFLVIMGDGGDDIVVMSRDADRGSVGKSSIDSGGVGRPGSWKVI
jgi:hypothetical protein